MTTALVLREEFNRLSKAEKKTLIEGLRKQYSNKEIMESLGMKEATYYYHLSQIGVKRSRRGRPSKKVVSEKNVLPNVVTNDATQESKPTAKSVSQALGFSVEINGKNNKVDLKSKLESILNLVNDDSVLEFELKINIA